MQEVTTRSSTKVADETGSPAVTVVAASEKDVVAVVDASISTTSLSTTISDASEGDKTDTAVNAFSPPKPTADSTEIAPTDGVDDDDDDDSEALAELTLSQAQLSFVLCQIARQLEYYFSQQNLSKDTYLQTLRQLNDGCVPVTILANFAKIQFILSPYFPLFCDEEARIQVILQAVTEATELLSVHSIDTATGKIATDETPSSATTILAIGPVHKEPLTLPSFSSSATDGSLSQQQLQQQQQQQREHSSSSNTIILRDVDPDVTEKEVRELFEQIEGCPAIVSIHADVACCWFITLDTTSRQEMLRVMMQVRTQTLRGNYLQARLKATPLVIDPAAPVHALMPTLLHHSTSLTSLMWMMGGSHVDLMGPGGAACPLKKKKRRSKKKKKQTKDQQSNQPQQQQQQQPSQKQAQDHPTSKTSPSPASTARKTKDGSALTKAEAPPPPPSLGEEHFPTLQQDKKVEWETPPCDHRDLEEADEDDVKEGGSKGECSDQAMKSSGSSFSNKSMSDAASTATTTSSSMGDSCMPSKKSMSLPSLSGYAAALRKVSSPSTTVISEAEAVTPAAKAENAAAKSKAVSSNSGMSKKTSSSSFAISSGNGRKSKANDTHPEVVITPPTWGRGRSFADILRVE